MRGRKKGCGFGWVGKWEGPGRSWENYNQNILYEKKNYFKLIFSRNIFNNYFKDAAAKDLGRCPPKKKMVFCGELCPVAEQSLMFAQLTGAAIAERNLVLFHRQELHCHHC